MSKKVVRKSWLDLVAEYKALLASKRKPESTTEDTPESEYEALIGGNAESVIARKLSQNAVNGLHTTNNLPPVYGNSIATMSCPTGQGLVVFSVQSNDDESGYNFGSIAFFKESESLFIDAELVKHPRFAGKFVHSSTVRGGLRLNGTVSRYDRETQTFNEPTNSEVIVVTRIMESRDNWTPFDKSIIAR